MDLYPVAYEAMQYVWPNYSKLKFNIIRSFTYECITHWQNTCFLLMLYVGRAAQPRPYLEMKTP